VKQNPVRVKKMRQNKSWSRFLDADWTIIGDPAR
jgi:hypothetical protein